eukprot:CAMPEP_0184660182 /NCGR_PEP_ID=MMETSP0308-20130426/32798_1 /TAXON_ID=38269 /ORGANISM="Gloeochaete witrockiana, Strain SAG 46.84" /LENGTH=38 /DNA_ID= /DNA_START= /DNA_END= /DNA_ORIENTATION=
MENAAAPVLAESANDEGPAEGKGKLGAEEAGAGVPPKA